MHIMSLFVIELCRAPVTCSQQITPLNYWHLCLASARDPGLSPRPSPASIMQALWFF